MNWRVIGCGAAGIVAFVAIGLFGLSLAIPPSGCPDRLQHGAQEYLPVGVPTYEPRVPGTDEPPVQIGTTFIGLETRVVFAAPGDVPPSGSDKLPSRLALDCADGTYLAYRSEP